ncbi:hypothetical protein DHW03_03285 [Pedobacter yonginense]|uniref:DUF3899 domain-containing protein n=1 Tax=Pedobacter yonginense TaxID=651869 RepID=A0A317EPS8_9SPHI|nr:hypothetical protein [Pedobacter yonginense]PWS28871.1 hypothetical protein DHW03_03285 [Pedobacter yonginense]
MGVLFDFLSILIGRWILGGIGYWTRKGYFFISRTISKPDKTKRKSDLDEVIDIEDFSNRIIGIVVIFLVIALADIFF